MTDDELDTPPHYNVADLKRSIGEYNIKHEQLETRRIEILTQLNKVIAEIKKNRSKVEKLVEFKRNEEAKGENVVEDE